MTSPAFWRTTQSPIRMSLRRTSSRLWSVARATVEPATLTGVMCATGVSVPVRPTYGTMSSTNASTCSGGNLNAIAQRGARLTIPSRACWSNRSTLTTTPSVSYGSVVAGLAPALGEGDDALDVEAGLVRPG